PGFAPEIAELEFFVAHHTRVRRPAGLVFTGEIINHNTLELVGLVNHVMWNPEGMRHAARICNRLWAAAFVLCSRDTILRPDLHCHTDDFVALLPQQIPGNAGVHSTAHAKKNALFGFIHSLQGVSAKRPCSQRPNNFAKARISAKRRTSQSSGSTSPKAMP